MKLNVTVYPNEDGGFTAECQALPGCRQTGRTREQATRRIEDAIEGYLAAVGNFVPAHVDRDVVQA